MNSLDLAAAVEPNSLVLLTEAVRLQLKSVLADRLGAACEEGNSPDMQSLDSDQLLRRQVARHRQEVRRRPQAADIRYRYGLLLRQDGQLVPACRELAKVVHLAPTDVLAAVKLGICLQETGQVERSLEAFGRALGTCGQDLSRHYRLAVLFSDRRRFRPAIEQMRRESTLSAEAFESRLGLSLQDLGLVDRAAATWRSLSRMHHARVGRRRS